MNYKIRITEDNQAIVKRIADENGMNPNNFQFMLTKTFYIIKDNKFYVGNVGYNESIFLNYTELTTEQFIELFDKKETEPRKIIGYKAPCNIRQWAIKKGDIIKQQDSKSYTTKLHSFVYIPTEIAETWEPVFEQIEFKEEMLGEIVPPSKVTIVETEWKPKRGDRVLVWDDVESAAKERIFLSEIEGSWFPIIVVAPNEEYKFIQGEEFLTSAYRQMKPLPIEQPKETDFKSKFEAAIELIENEIKALENKRDYAAKDKLYQIASGLVSEIAQATKLLNKIKELK